MRTPEQLNNLRNVFCRLYTPLAKFWPDEAVDFLAEKIQTEVNNNYEWTWEIRVLTKTNSEDSWADIKPEPKVPRCTVYIINKKCNELLVKYPSIISILVIAKESPKMVFQFNS